MSKRYFHYLRFALILFLIPHTTANARNFNVGVIQFEPWGMFVNNQISGIHWDQIQTIFDRAHLKIDPYLLPFPRTIKRLNSGSIDCAIVAKNPKTSEAFHMVSFLYNLTVVAISHKDTKIEQYSDFINNENPIGFPNGTEKFFPLLFNDPLAKIHILLGHQQGPAMLARKRLSAFIGIKTTLWYEIKKQQLENVITFPGYEIKKIPVWLTCSKQSNISKEILKDLAQATLELKNEGYFIKSIQKWNPSFLRQK